MGRLRSTIEKVVVICNISGYSVHGECWLDLTDGQMQELDVSYGTDLCVEFEDRTYKAMYCRNYAGVPAFSMFLAYMSSDERYSLGIYNDVLTDYIDVEIGDDVKISVAGPTDSALICLTTSGVYPTTVKTMSRTRHSRTITR